jgi:hypothetical protein
MRNPPGALRRAGTANSGPSRDEGSYDWRAQHDDIPELVTVARTVSRSGNQITTAVVTGITKVTSESPDRLAEPGAGLVYRCRNPLDQGPGVRIAGTRGYRRRSLCDSRADAYGKSGGNPIRADFEGPANSRCPSAQAITSPQDAARTYTGEKSGSGGPRGSVLHGRSESHNPRARERKLKVVALRGTRLTIVAGIVIALLAALAAIGITTATGHSDIFRATGHVNGVLADEIDWW